MKKNKFSNLILVYFLIISILIFSIHLSTSNYLSLWNNISKNKIMPSNKPLSSSCNLQLWNYTTGGIVWGVSISADGEYFVAGSGDDKLYLFKKTSSSPYWIYSGNSYFASVAISANGQYIIAGGGESRVYFFNKSCNEPLWNFTPGVFDTDAVAISADGQYIVVAKGNFNVYLFNKTSSTPIQTWEMGFPVGTVDISADGNYIVVGTALGISPYNVTLFNRTSSTPLWNYTTEGSITEVAISADGQYIVAGALNNKVYLFHKNSSTLLWNFTAITCISSVDISADGQYIVAGCWDKKVYLFHRDNSTPLWSYTAGDEVWHVAISADGQYLAAGSDDNKTYLFHKNNSTPLWKNTTGNWIQSIDISANGHHMVFGSRDNGIYFFQNISESISSVPKPRLSPLLILMLEQPEFNVLLIPLILGIGVAIFIGVASYFKVKKGVWPWSGKITKDKFKKFFRISKRKPSKVSYKRKREKIVESYQPASQKIESSAPYLEEENLKVEKKAVEEILNSINSLTKEELIDFISNFIEDLKEIIEIKHPFIVSAQNWLQKISDYPLSKLTLVDSQKLAAEILRWEIFNK